MFHLLLSTLCCGYDVVSAIQLSSSVGKFVSLIARWVKLLGLVDEATVCGRGARSAGYFPDASIRIKVSLGCRSHPNRRDGSFVTIERIERELSSTGDSQVINRSIAALALLVLPCLAVTAGEGNIFLLGNSLTWDTVPAKLDGEVQWHVDCGKSLPYIVGNPTNPCVKSSTLWPTALSKTQYDVISIQVHYGSTLKEDVNAVLRLIETQPDAKVVIHTGWPRSAQRAEEWADSDVSSSSTMKHQRAYFDSLLNNLRASRPEQEFCRSYAMDLLQIVAADVQAGEAGVGSVDELYRDAIHMDVVTGRYLMHNAMRHAVGQPRSANGFEQLEPQIKVYLDSVLDRGLKKEIGSVDDRRGDF